jgi:hypothetical protein
VPFGSMLLQGAVAASALPLLLPFFTEVRGTGILRSSRRNL